MNTRNRNALVSALNKMALKDFNSSVEREKADELLRLLEESNDAEKGGKRNCRSSKCSVSLPRSAWR
jgi:hypothetical protein